MAELQRRQKRLTARRDALLQQLEEACDVAQPSSSKPKSTQSASVMSKQELQRYDREGTLKDLPALSSVPVSCGDFNQRNKLSPRFSLVQRRGPAPEGLVPPYEVSTHAVEGHQPEHVRKRRVSGDAHRTRKEPLLPAACCRLQGWVTSCVPSPRTFHTSLFRSLTVILITRCSSVACFTLRPGFTLVVTPLVSLMEDQVMSLKATNVSVAMLNASSSKVGVGCSAGLPVNWSSCVIVRWSPVYLLIFSHGSLVVTFVCTHNQYFFWGGWRLYLNTTIFSALFSVCDDSHHLVTTKHSLYYLFIWLWILLRTTLTGQII